ncbi:uncharacterized protein V6R79_019815 [Siganus canaliculatus]
MVKPPCQRDVHVPVDGGAAGNPTTHIKPVITCSKHRFQLSLESTVKKLQMFYARVEPWGLLVRVPSYNIAAAANSTVPNCDPLRVPRLKRGLERTWTRTPAPADHRNQTDPDPDPDPDPDVDPPGGAR